METRHFIIVAQNYVAKNKLAQQIQEAILPLDRTIFPNAAAAKQKINNRFRQVCDEYLRSGGKAMLPELREYATTNGFGIQITDCIILQAQRVSEEIQ